MKKIDFNIFVVPVHLFPFLKLILIKSFRKSRIADLRHTFKKRAFLTSHTALPDFFQHVGKQRKWV